MHLLIPFAAPLSDAGRATLQGLRWSGLRALLAGRTGARDDGDAFGLSPPHERAAARAWGWSGADGQLPFAARLAAQDGIEPGELPWGLLTPAHWRVGSEQPRMADPASLELDADASRALFGAVQEVFTSEGFVAVWGAPLRWYLAHESLAALPTASPDRVIGRSVDRWLPSGSGARLLRRLQNEAQMVLHGHARNRQREERGLPALNSFWLSGCGVAQACRGELQIDDRLRRPALDEDWTGWAAAWAQLDAALPGLRPTRLTLCGERSAVEFDLQPLGPWRRLAARWAQPGVAALLESL